MFIRTVHTDTFSIGYAILPQKFTVAAMSHDFHMSDVIIVYTCIFVQFASVLA